MSKLVDWQDRSTCVLFGDGAGAVIIKSANADEHEGIITTKIHADGAYEDILYTDGGVSRTQTSGVMHMVGRDVFKHAVEKMSQNINDLLEQSGYAKENLNWLIPHQANARILSAIATRVDIPAEKIAMTLDQQANTCAATIPLALDYQVRSGKIKSNDLILMTALGGGLAWGGCMLRWL